MEITFDVWRGDEEVERTVTDIETEDGFVIGYEVEPVDDLTEAERRDAVERIYEAMERRKRDDAWEQGTDTRWGQL